MHFIPEASLEYMVAWGPDGRQLLFSRFDSGSGLTAHVVDRDAKIVSPLITEDASELYYHNYWHSDLSPDGLRIAYSTVCAFRMDVGEAGQRMQQPVGGGREIDRQSVEKLRFNLAALDIDGTLDEWLTINPYDEYFPVWSPDGESIAYFADLDGNENQFGREIRIMSVMGGDLDPTRLLRESDLYRFDYDQRYMPRFADYPVKWSPSGDRLAFLVYETVRERVEVEGGNYPEPWATKVAGSWGVYTVARDGSSLRRISGSLGGVSWSPDGRRLALMRIEGPDIAVVTVSADGADATVIARLSDEEVDWKYPGIPWFIPISWSPGGGHILFRCGVRMCVVTVDGDRIGSWSVAGVQGAGLARAAWSPDGSRIAVVGEFDGASFNKDRRIIENVDVGRMSASADRSYQIVLFTVAPDGSDARLVVGRTGNGKLEALGNREAEVPGASS